LPGSEANMMNLYSRYLFPRLLDAAMGSDTINYYRETLLQNLTGQILEIGFGTGLNLTHYPQNIDKLTAVDVNEGMSKIAQKRIEKAPFPVEFKLINGQSLPFPNDAFDRIVSTWTLCSIANIHQALNEVSCVLRVGGELLFIEHGLSDNPNVQVWQNRLTPLQKCVGDGCHLNRNIKALISQHFPTVQVETFKLETEPELIGYTYQGVATKQ